MSLHVHWQLEYSSDPAFNIIISLCAHGQVDEMPPCQKNPQGIVMSIQSVRCNSEQLKSNDQKLALAKEAVKPTLRALGLSTEDVDATIDTNEGVHFEVSIPGVFGMLACKINALEDKLNMRSYKEALSVVASTISSFTDNVLLIPLKINQKSNAARGAYFQLLESGDHDACSMAAQAFSDSGVDISVDEFLHLRHGISQPRNRHQHELADAEDFAEALENLQLDHKKKTLLTRLHVHELEADGHVFTSSRLSACNLPAVSAGTICMS